MSTWAPVRAHPDSAWLDGDGRRSVQEKDHEWRHKRAFTPAHAPPCPPPRPHPRVLITEAFQMSATEVTVGQYRQFDPKHRGRHEDDAVTEVSWKEVVTFCEWLSKKEGTTDRLPPRSSFTSLTSQGSLSPSVL